MKNVPITLKLLQEYLNDPDESIMVSFGPSPPCTPCPIHKRPTLDGFVAWLEKQQVPRKQKAKR